MSRNIRKNRGAQEVRILPPRLKSSRINTQFMRLLSLENESCVSASVGEKVYFKSAVAMPYPYKLPRLIIPDSKSKDQRWVIKFYVWSKDHGKMIMQRDTSCNAEKDVVKRKTLALQQIKDIGNLLKTGHHLDSQKREAMALEAIKHGQNEFIKFIDALELVIKFKRGQNIKSIRNYEQCYSRLLDWLKLHPNIKHLPARMITRVQMEDFLESLGSEKRPLSGRSYNNYVFILRHMFQVMVDKEYIPSNPTEKITTRRKSLGRNIAYTIDQQKTLIEFMQSKYPGMLAFCQVMYYTLMRTNEISNMQAWWIGAYEKDKIYLPKEFSKNGQERHITIPPQLGRIIKNLKWRELPPDTFLFSSGYRPGKKQVQSRMHANKYRRWVLEKLNFPKDYTMYSWKHTGVVFLYRNNIPRAEIRMQAGFMDDISFEAYLKSLGLFENELLKANYPSLPV